MIRVHVVWKVREKSIKSWVSQEKSERVRESERERGKARESLRQSGNYFPNAKRPEKVKAKFLTILNEVQKFYFFKYISRPPKRIMSFLTLLAIGVNCHV